MEFAKNKRMMLVLAMLVVVLVLAGCGGAATTTAEVQQVTPQAIHARLPEALNNGMILLDVRTPEEWVQGHIEGATLIPLQELETRAPQELPTDAEIVIYCRSGNRSAQAADMLVEMGYTDVADMGGIIDWQAAGYTVVTGQ